MSAGWHKFANRLTDAAALPDEEAGQMAHSASPLWRGISAGMAQILLPLVRRGGWRIAGARHASNSSDGESEESRSPIAAAAELRVDTVKATLERLVRSFENSARNPQTSREGLNALLEVGRSYLEVGLVQEAIETFRLTTEIERSFREALSPMLQAGYLQSQYGRLKEARQTFRYILDVDPKNQDALSALLQLGYRFIEIKKLADADETFTLMVNADPYNSGALIGLATVSARNGRFDEATSRYRQVFKIDPVNSQALRGLLEKSILRKMGVLKHDPHFVGIRERLAEQIGIRQREKVRLLKVAERLSYLRAKQERLEAEKPRRARAAAVSPPDGERGPPLNIAMIHSSVPRAIGGVNTIIADHTKHLTAAGHHVTWIAQYAGEGEPYNLPNLTIRLFPTDRELPKEERALNPEQKAYNHIKKQIQDMEVVIIHNVLTVHPLDSPFNRALRTVIQEDKRNKKFIYWAHNVDYSASPAIEGVKYVTVSDWYRDGDVSRLLRLPVGRIEDVRALTTIHCGKDPKIVDPAIPFDFTPEAVDIARQEKLLDQDIVLVYPTRLDWNKRPEAAVRILGHLIRIGLKAKLIIPTGLGLHGVMDEKTRHYYSYLRNYIRSLADELKIEDEESLRDGKRNYRVMKHRVNQKVMQGLTPGFLNEVARRLGEDESTSGRAANDIMARINSKLFEQGYAFDLWSSLKDVVLSNGLDHANPGRSLAHALEERIVGPLADVIEARRIPPGRPWNPTCIEARLDGEELAFSELRGLNRHIVFLNTDEIEGFEHQRDVIRDLYLLSDVLVYPSNWESFGIQLLEAGAAGVPIGASERIGTLGEVVAENAFRFNPDDDLQDTAVRLVSYVTSDEIDQTRDRLWDRVNELFSWDHLFDLISSRLLDIETRSIAMPGSLSRRSCR